MTDQMQKLWYSWQAADEAWHNQLVAAFGKDACNRRYDPARVKLTTHPASCLEAEAKWDSAGQAYKEYMGYAK